MPRRTAAQRLDDEKAAHEAQKKKARVTIDKVAAQRKAAKSTVAKKVGPSTHKPVQKIKTSDNWVSGLKKRVRGYFAKENAKKATRDTTRTEAVKKDLRRNLTEEEIKKLRGKKG